MAGTNAAAAKRALLDLIRDSAELPAGVEVGYSYSGKLVGGSREFIYGGTVSGPVELAAMQGGSRLRRHENLTLNLHIVAVMPGEETTVNTDARVAEIGVVVEHLVATNPTLGDLPDLKLAQIVSVELDGGVDDDSAESVLTYQIALKSLPR